jgi:hypothetical protein
MSVLENSKISRQPPGFKTRYISPMHRPLSVTLRKPKAIDTQTSRTLMENTTHFGFKDVATQDKQGMVRSVFDSVANKYDLMNDVLSFGA